ncbi:adenylate/guanylate cyclase domain-containing protein [Massilia terrae]|uniref:Adenylate/guanylate cyclase domain-containing protein n=1 Tax=Massilia terrae TaxID=1811224 RepID=A0ABT2CVF1_9BURK|nr:adenylate/guanylate cyclase domain-containing protein [Massilia terrae]MCS0657942.1 adenylate/guanylate cyclase domain-containing protein [Massilia terrae]
MTTILKTVVPAEAGTHRQAALPHTRHGSRPSPGRRFSEWGKKYGLRWALGLALTIVAALYPLGFWSSSFIERQDTVLSDLRMRLEPPVLDPRIVIVDIDSKSLTRIGRFPWSRNILARLVSQLTDHYHAGAVGFDISFPEPDNSSGYAVLEKLGEQDPALRARLGELKGALDYDGLFAQAMRGHPVVLGYNVAADQQKGKLPAPAFTLADLNGADVTSYRSKGYEANVARLQDAAAGAGFFTVEPDSDGVVRSAPLLYRIGEGYYPALSLATVAAYKKAEAITPNVKDDEVEAVVLFGESGASEVPMGSALTTIIQYRGSGGPAGEAFRYVSASDVLSGAAPASVLRNAIVLVGTTAPGLQDLRATPVNPQYPGVEAHANLIKSILDGHFKRRPIDGFLTEAEQIAVVGVALAVALAVLAPVYQVLLAGAALAGSLGFNYAMYSQRDLVLDVFPCLLLVAVLFLMNLAWGYFAEFRKGRALVSRFGEYVAPELVAQMAENPEAYNMEGESRELTVMFVDVRGFTTISEGLSPKELREYINLYLTAMSEDIRSSHQGTLDKYIGDAVMAFWGAPVAFPDHASRAVATSLLMQQSAARLNRDFVKRGWPELKIGIGLNSGPMHVGDMGSAIRRAYTVMGDAVNLGSRLEGITKVYGVGICVGEATRRAAPDFVYRELDLVRVKGKNEPVAIFEPVGPAAEVGPAERAEIAAWDEALALVRAQDWDAAQGRIAALRAAHPDRGLYALYLARIDRYRQHPPGAGWDGVISFETK